MAAPELLSARSLGVLAMAAGALGILYTPFYAAAYLATSPDRPLVPWDEALRGAVPAAFDFAAPHDVYVTYGRIFPLVVAGLLAGMWALRGFHGPAPARLLRASYYGLVGTQSVLVVGVVVEFYTPYLSEAFLVVFPAVMLGLVSYILYGIASLRARTLPRSASWMLIAGAALVVPLVALFGHIPMALYGLYAAWIRVGRLEAQAIPPHPATKEMAGSA